MSARPPSFVAKDSVPRDRMADAYRILTAGRKLGPVMVAYSGGKDGLAAALLARDVGVGGLNVCELSFTFRRQEQDIRATAHRFGINVVYRHHLSLGWLAAHPQYLFTHDMKLNGALCHLRQQNSVESYARRHGIQVVITGRKTLGNSVRQAIDPRKNGTTGCHPLRGWDDGDVWALLRDRGVPMPWVYSTPFGRRQGNTGWPFCRLGSTIQENYEIIYQIEAETVLDAAEAGVPGAREFLDGYADRLSHIAPPCGEEHPRPS